MKKLLLLLLIPIVFLLFLRKTPKPQEVLLPRPTVFIEKPKEGYAIIKTQPNRVTLIPNFSDKKSSSELFEQNNCIAGVNGGFYDTENRPLGLFSIGNEILRKQSDSLLINGFIGIDSDDTPFISYNMPTDSTKFILQTGPLLIANGQPLPLAIKNDEHARRMVAAIDTNGMIIFLTLYNPDAVFDGPLLGDSPKILSEINQKELLNIIDAINLDGGSASAFYNEATSLSELTAIGSFFCAK